MSTKEFASISDLKKFIDSEGVESEIAEWRDYQSSSFRDDKDEIIQTLCGFANNKGGVLIIGIENKSRKIVYTDIDKNDFERTLNNWMYEWTEPKGISYKVCLVEDEQGKCITVFVDTKPATSYAQLTDRPRRIYALPYRTPGATRNYPFSDFINLHTSRFLQDMALIGKLAIEKDQNELTLNELTQGVFRDEKPLNPKLINIYLEMLKTKDLSSENLKEIFATLRREANRINNNNDVVEEEQKIIRDLIVQINNLLNNVDVDENLIDSMLEILSSLTTTPKTLQLVKDICYDYFKEQYKNKNGKFYNRIIRILYSCGYFEDIIDEIMKAINNKDRGLFGLLVSNLDYSKVKEKIPELLRELYMKIESLDSITDKELVAQIRDEIRQLEDNI